jgi:hypothetical protein
VHRALSRPQGPVGRYWAGRRGPSTSSVLVVPSIPPSTDALTSAGVKSGWRSRKLSRSVVPLTPPLMAALPSAGVKSCSSAVRRNWLGASWAGSPSVSPPGGSVARQMPYYHTNGQLDGRPCCTPRWGRAVGFEGRDQVSEGSSVRGASSFDT